MNDWIQQGYGVRPCTPVVSNHSVLVPVTSCFLKRCIPSYLKFLHNCFLLRNMESANVASYIALLEQYNYHLQCIVQQWKPYVPDIIIQKSQIWQAILPRPSSHFPSSSSPSYQVQLNRQHSLPGPTKSEEKWRKYLQTFINKIPTAEKWSEHIKVPSVPILGVILQSDIIATSTET